jgi:hypothetical protein
LLCGPPENLKKYLILQVWSFFLKDLQSLNFFWKQKFSQLNEQ